MLSKIYKNNRYVIFVVNNCFAGYMRKYGGIVRVLSESTTSIYMHFSDSER